MADIKVQYVEADIASGNSSVTATSGGGDFTELTDYTKAFLVVSNNYGHCGFGDSGGSLSNNQQNTFVRASLDSNTQITFTRGSTGAGSLSAMCGVYIVEYIGSAGGPNEFIVRGSGSYTYDDADGASKDSAAISNISNLSDCVPFCTLSTTRSATAINDPAMGYTVVNDGSNDVVRATQSTYSPDGTRTIQWYCVEFTGSNWTIQSFIHDYDSGTNGSDVHGHTISITAVDQTWAFSYGLRENYELDEDRMFGWITSTTNMNFDREGYTGSTYDGYQYVYLIENPQLSVQHSNSDPSDTKIWTGSGSGNVDRDVTVTSYDNTNAICWGEADSDSLTNRGTGQWRVKPQSSTSARFSRGYDEGNTDYTLQVVDFSGLEPAASGLLLQSSNSAGF